MASELEELFTQATTQCNDLGDGIDGVMTAIGRVVSRSRDLAEAMKGGASEVRNALQELTLRIERAEGELGEAAGEAEEGLRSAIEEAGEARTALQELSERGEAGTAEIDSVVERVSSDLAAAFQTASQELNDYGSHVAEFSQSTAERVAGTQRSLAAFAEEVDEARDDLETKKEGWLTAIDGLTTAVSREAREAVAALAAGLREQSTGMLEAGNGVVLDHNDAMAAIKAEFADDVAAELGDALVPLAEALSAIGAVAEARRVELSQRVQAVMARIEDLAPAIGDLSERLLRAQGLGEA